MECSDKRSKVAGFTWLNPRRGGGQGNLKGFTLIELLVVIAIIGLLVSLAMTAAFRYKDKANDARIQADLSQLRIIAAKIDNEEDHYSDLCKQGYLNIKHDNYGDELKIIDENIKIIVGGERAVCYAGEESFCVQSRALTGGYLCVDSTGYVGKQDDSNCERKDKKCAK